MQFASIICGYKTVVDTLDDCKTCLKFQYPSGGPSEIVNKEAKQDDPRKRKPDISRAKEQLNWAPKVNYTQCKMIF